MEEDIKILKEMLNNTKKNRKGHEEIRFEVNSVYYETIENVLAELEKTYWEDYIQKQNEAMQICKQCKYIKKSKELETKQQKLIEKLEEDIEYYECDLLRIRQIGLDENDEQVITDKILIDKFKEILEMMKGENE